MPASSSARSSAQTSAGPSRHGSSRSRERTRSWSSSRSPSSSDDEDDDRWPDFTAKKYILRGDNVAKREETRRKGVQLMDAVLNVKDDRSVGGQRRRGRGRVSSRADLSSSLSPLVVEASSSRGLSSTCQTPRCTQTTTTSSSIRRRSTCARSVGQAVGAHGTTSPELTGHCRARRADAHLHLLPLQEKIIRGRRYDLAPIRELIAYCFRSSKKCQSQKTTVTHPPGSAESTRRQQY